MDRYKKLNLLVVIIVAGLAFACALGEIDVIATSKLDGLYKLEGILDVFALALSFIYLVLGYKKGVANYYKASILIAAAHALVVTSVASNEPTKYVSIISCAICFGLLLGLAFGKNNGKKESLIICGIIVVLRVLGILFNANGLTDPKTLLIISQLILAITVTVITVAKYIDKDERGTI